MELHLEDPKNKDPLIEPISTSPTTPAHFSQSIQHVLEMILSNLNTAQLFKCRSISHQWNSIASDLIRKRLKIIFYEKQYYPWNLNRANRAKSENIINKQITELDTLPLNPESPFPFPVSNFKFDFVDIYDPQVSHFLDIHGCHIQELCLQSGVKRTEAQLMDFLATLLWKQTRNLEILTLSLNPTDIKWQNDEDEDQVFPSDPSASYMLPKNLEFFEIYSCAQYEENLCSKLRVLHFKCKISAKLFEVIYRIVSPQLQEIDISSHYFQFLVTPLNRAHVLTNFYSSKWTDYFQDDFVLEFLKLLNVKNRLKLKTVVLRLQDMDSYYKHENGLMRLVDIINYLFECSCDSVTSLGWINMGCITNSGIHWRRMRNLKKLTVGPYAVNRFSSHPPAHIFPTGFSPVKIFPQLETVQICIHSKCDTLLDCLHSLNLEPTPSVKVVDVRGESLCAEMVAENASIIKSLFPLARIVTGRTCTRDSLYPFLC